MNGLEIVFVATSNKFFHYLNYYTQLINCEN